MHEGLPSVCAPPGVSISLLSGYLLTMASLRGEREGLLQGEEGAEALQRRPSGHMPRRVAAPF